VNFLRKLIPGGKKPRLILAGSLLVFVLWLVHGAKGMFGQGDTVSFSTPTVSLALDSPTGEEAYTALSLSNMVPGGDVYLGLTVTNTGAAGFRYSMSSTASGDGTLAKDLWIGIAVTDGTGCSSSDYSSGVPLMSDKAGLSQAVISGESLAASDSEYLCFHIRLPPGSPASAQAMSAQTTLDFTAEPA
jgi:hypothetical protein